MRRLAITFLLALAACAAPTTATTTSSLPPTSTTVPAVVTTTTASSMDVEVQGCESPPVTFGPLCEIYELLQTWYRDAPIDAGALAEVAIRGLDEYSATDTEEPPRTLFCAVPEAAFTILCDELATRVASSRIPVGPAVEAAVSHMVNSGLDPFTYYLPPDQAGAIRLNGIVGGIGVLLDARDAAGSKCTRISDVCELEIIVVLEDNPGWDAGLETGDIITRVNGESVVGKGFNAVVSSIAGEETGQVELVIDRNGTEMMLTIERRELNVPTVDIGFPFPDVGYIKIPDFELDIPPLVSDALAELTQSAPDTLLVDLRDNPGGLVDAFLEVADEFIDGGVVMVSEATTEREEYKALPGGTATTQRLVVLVNQGTASAAEVLAGALRDRRNARIVGTNTFGKDAVQIPFTLRNGGELHVAIARWSTPAGETVGEGGLTPDGQVTWPSEGTLEEIAEIALEAAS